jgi:hypothetical protein
MSITRDDVADLREGDVVELTSTTWPDGAVRGRLRNDGLYKSLVLKSPCGEESYVIRNAQGDPSCADQRSLTVVSRAPRPLYVNHPRTEPSCGDVFQPEFSQWPIWVAGHDRIAEHKSAESCRWIGPGSLPAHLRLLVDGETGQVVP